MQTITMRRPIAKKRSDEMHVTRSIQDRLARCTYAFVYCNVRWEYNDGVLTLRGSVPSFYLKQTLQELLRDIKHVKKINNDVDVVCSGGLSSTRRNNKPR